MTLSITILNIMIVSIMTFRKTPFSIMTYSIMTFILMKLSIKYLFVILRSITLYRYRNAQCRNWSILGRTSLSWMSLCLSVVAPFLHLSDAEKKLNLRLRLSTLRTSLKIVEIISMNSLMLKKYPCLRLRLSMLRPSVKIVLIVLARQDWVLDFWPFISPKQSHSANS